MTPSPTACHVCAFPCSKRHTCCPGCGVSIVNTKLKLKRSINEKAIRTRLLTLTELDPGQKNTTACATEQEKFVAFLAARVAPLGPKTLLECCPEDVVAYLIYREEDGRTAYHLNSCSLNRFSKKKKPMCNCPRRMAIKCLKGLVSKLKPLFQGPVWCQQTQKGNPVDSKVVVNFLQAVTRDAVDAGVTPFQAPPLYSDKAEKLVKALRLWSLESLDQSSGPLKRGNLRRLRYAMDLSIITILLQTGRRLDEVTLLRSDCVLTLDENSILLHFYWGKTLRTGACEPIVLVRDLGVPLLCPIRALKFFYAMLIQSKCSVNPAILFPEIKSATHLTDKRCDPDGFRVRFKSYLTALGINDDETTHSFRSGCAYEMLDDGKDVETVMMQIGWKCKESLDWYVKAQRFRLNMMAARESSLADRTGFANRQRKQDDLSSYKSFF